jgi:hypothetical protein
MYMTTEIGVQVNLTDFYQMLEKHEWFHIIDEDEARYQAGAEFYENLRKLADQSPEHKDLFNKYERWVWSKSNGGLTEVPKPPVPVSVTTEVTK